MPLPTITPIDIPGGSTATNLETAINALIDQHIVSGVSLYQGITLTTADGSTITIDAPAHTKGIISGLTPTRSSALNYSIAIGSYQVAGLVKVITSPVALVCGAPDATNPRYDLIVGNNLGVLSVVAGTPSATPAYPSITSNQTILHVVGVPSSASAYVDSAVVSQKVDTSTIPAIQVNPQGQVSFGGALIKPRVVTYTADGAVDITTTVHAVDTSTGGAPIALDMPSYAEATDLEGITFSFFDTGNAATDNWTVEVAGGGGTIATATTNNQVIRITVIGGLYIVG